MIRINLLPKDRIKKKTVPLKEIYLASLVLAILGIICSFVWLQYQSNKYHQKIAKLETELKKYKTIEQKIIKIKKDKEEAIKKLVILSQLIKNSPEMIKNIHITIKEIPAKRLYLTEYSYNENNITIKGNALDLETIAYYIDRLEKTKEFKNVELEGTNIKKVKDYKLTTFTIKVIP